MDIDVKGFGRVVGLSDERLRYYKRIMAFFNKYATFHFEAYTSIDDVTNPQTNVIYLVGPKGNLDDKYEEYIYDNTKQDPWIKIGDTSIDLSQYVTVAELIEELSKYTTTENLTELLNGKQNTEEGKGLSTNDFTNALKGKLDGIQSGAQKNVNADWNSESGDSQILNKPDLSGFITKTVNDLTNYYLKSEVYTKEQVAALIATINQFHYEVYPTLNEIVSPQNNVLYLIGPTGTGSDKYEEYIYPSAETGWTKIGDTSIDLRNYVTIDILNNALATKQNIINDLSNIRAGAAAGATALQSIDENLNEQGFVHRICPSTINPKSIILNKIKGKTLAWNQLVDYANMSGVSSTAITLITNGVRATTNTQYVQVNIKVLNITPSHKYLFKFFSSTTENLTASQIVLLNDSSQVLERFNYVPVMGENSNILSVNVSAYYLQIQTRSNNGVNSNGYTIDLTNIVFIDLTLMFGAGNEPTTVEEFESMFPGYHEYNDGKLISNDAESIETVGFNQWDEEWEVGSLDGSTGLPVSNNSLIRSKNFTTCLPDTDYYFKATNFNIFWYNSSGQFLSVSSNLNGVNHSPTNAHFLKIRSDTSYGIVYNYDICINISDPAKNGTYEPYHKSKINLNLNSFKVKDSQGNIITINGGLKSAGSVYDEIIGDKYIKRVGSVNMSECPIGNTTPGVRCVFNPDGMKAWISRTPYTDGVILNTTKYKSNTDDENYNCWIGGLTSGEIAIYDSAFTDEAAIRQIMSGIVAYYELATPIEYELVEPIVPIGKAGITEARISPNTDKLSAPFCGDITYTLADIYVPELKSINYITKITEITWSELKSLRDGGNLTPGMQYRITDYQCTTISNDTTIRSANHQFDIIVIADDVDKLNENARACLHDGDTYFANSKLENWKLKYCLDNDITKFNWVHQLNGKGVIYWMKDEWNNECSYDFKNIQFKKSNIWLYTFNVDDPNDQTNKLDDSVYTTNCHNNIIKPYFESIYKLNRNTFGNSCYNNILESGCYDNTFGNTCFNNFLDNTCYRNTFGDECRWNHFGVNCTNNILGNSCIKITFFQVCYNNTINNRVENVIFEQNCSNNTLGVANKFVKLGFDCNHNVFDDYCYRNTLGSYCENNQFGNSSSSNVLGTGCSRNTLDSNCSYNCIIDDSYDNTFGISCTRNILITSTNNTFGNYCTNNKLINSSNNSFLIFNARNIFESSSYITVKDYFINNIFKYCNHINVQKIGVTNIIIENGNTYIDITSTQTTSSTNKLQNFKIAQGVNTTAIVKTISHDTINDAFQTIYKPVGSTEVEI